MAEFFCQCTATIRLGPRKRRRFSNAPALRMCLRLEKLVLTLQRAIDPWHPNKHESLIPSRIGKVHTPEPRPYGNHLGE